MTLMDEDEIAQIERGVAFARQSRGYEIVEIKTFDLIRLLMAAPDDATFDLSLEQTETLIRLARRDQAVSPEAREEK